VLGWNQLEGVSGLFPAVNEALNEVIRNSMPQAARIRADGMATRLPLVE